MLPGGPSVSPLRSTRRRNGDGGAAEVERIIVTGSNIPTAEEVGPNPVLSINRDLINKSGAQTAEQLLKALPVANGGGVPVSNNATGFTPGATAISLRGLGPEATFVLRMAGVSRLTRSVMAERAPFSICAPFRNRQLKASKF